MYSWAATRTRYSPAAVAHHSMVPMMSVSMRRHSTHHTKLMMPLAHSQNVPPRTGLEPRPR